MANEIRKDNEKRGFRLSVDAWAVAAAALFAILVRVGALKHVPW